MFKSFDDHPFGGEEVFEVVFVFDFEEAFFFLRIVLVSEEDLLGLVALPLCEVVLGLLFPL